DRSSWACSTQPTAACANESRGAAARGIGGGIGRTNEPKHDAVISLWISLPRTPTLGYDGGLSTPNCVTHLLGSKSHPCPHLFRLARPLPTSHYPRPALVGHSDAHGGR